MIGSLHSIQFGKNYKLASGSQKFLNLKYWLILWYQYELQKDQDPPYCSD